jgi:hypothetical protein
VNALESRDQIINLGDVLGVKGAHRGNASHWRSSATVPGCSLGLLTLSHGAEDTTKANTEERRWRWRLGYRNSTTWSWTDDSIGGRRTGSWSCCRVCMGRNGRSVITSGTGANLYLRQSCCWCHHVRRRGR